MKTKKGVINSLCANVKFYDVGEEVDGLKADLRTLSAFVDLELPGI